MAEQAPSKDFKYIIRVANTDLDGNKSIAIALHKIKGVSFMFANAVLHLAGVDPNEKAGHLKDAQVQKLDAIVKDPLGSGVPKWLINRVNDPETGEDRHLIGADIRFVQDNDLKNMKIVKSYKGLRHQWKLPVRGQRTKSNFRRTKSKGKASLGVKRKK